MYESFYALKANPFRLVPDARFYYASSGHKRGLAYLRYGLHQGQGFVVVTGRPGTGKSTLVQTLFSELTDQQLIVASLTSTNLGASDILQAVGNSFDVYGDANNKASLLIGIENFLQAKARQGKRVILIVDEAHNLPQASLEELRMLSNFQLGDKSLLQILLLGQHQLPEILARPDMEQLSQRVIASCHLQSLSKAETRAYIGHRLQCVGWCGDPSISGEAVAVVYAASTGIPRLINIFCDRMFLAASLDGKHNIDLQLAKLVLIELQQEATGTFNMVSLKADDLLGFDPLPGDDFVLPPESVLEAGKKIQNDGNSSHSTPPRRVNESPEVDDIVSSVNTRPDETNFEPAFSSEPSPDKSSVAVEKHHHSDDSGNVGQQTVDSSEQPSLGDETEKTRSWKKTVAMIVLIVVALIFIVALFINVDNEKLLEHIQSDVSSDEIATTSAAQEIQIDTTQQLEVKPVGTTDKQTAPSTQFNNTENDLAAEKALTQVSIRTESGLGFEDVSLEHLTVLDNAVEVDNSVAIDNEVITEASTPLQISEPIPLFIEELAPPEVVSPDSISATNISETVGAIQNTDVAAPEVDKPAAKESISESELKALIVDLVSLYEKGDTNNFSALFAKDAVANGMNGVEKIRKDYKRLFSSTDKRQMRVEDMQWQHNASKASGRGVFTVSVWKTADLEPLLQQGVLNIELVKNDKKLLVTSFSHELD